MRTAKQEYPEVPSFGSKDKLNTVVHFGKAATKMSTILRHLLVCFFLVGNVFAKNGGMPLRDEDFGGSKTKAAGRYFFLLFGK